MCDIEADLGERVDLGKFRNDTCDNVTCEKKPDTAQDCDYSNCQIDLVKKCHEGSYFINSTRVVDAIECLTSRSCYLKLRTPQCGNYFSTSFALIELLLSPVKLIRRARGFTYRRSEQMKDRKEMQRRTGREVEREREREEKRN